jgi:hypothetical protein
MNNELERTWKETVASWPNLRQYLHQFFAALWMMNLTVFQIISSGYLVECWEAGRDVYVSEDKVPTYRTVTSKDTNAATPLDRSISGYSARIK